MTDAEKMNMLEEIMELDEGTLSADDLLDNYEEWDSLTALSFISLMDEKFHKTFTGAQVRELKTVADALKVME